MNAPRSIEEIQAAVQAAHAAGTRLGAFDLTRLNRLLEHAPEDMVATVETGITLGELQRVLGARRQWLPVDPPRPEELTVHELLAENRSGPRRFGLGTVRDYLIGMRAVLGQGELIKAGGVVVKNVAGFDLGKLFIGARGTLGIIVEATFKLRPLPESEAWMSSEVVQAADAGRLAEQVLESALAPVALDWAGGPGGGRTWVNLAFAGAREDVEEQSAQAQALGFRTASAPDYDSFWQGPGEPQSHSVLPSQLPEFIQSVQPAEFVARLGNGIVYWRGGQKVQAEVGPAVRRLMRGVKGTYDPKGVFPDYSW